MKTSTGHTGHRQRLRNRFSKDRTSFSDVDLLELLLTYAIPRQDVAPLAEALLDRFGSLDAVFSATHGELTEVTGIGDVSAIFLEVVGELHNNRARADIKAPQLAVVSNEGQDGDETGTGTEVIEEPQLETSSPTPPPPPPTKADIRAYTNDLSKVALDYLPKAAEFGGLESFSAFLEEQLPYNSGVTRKRYANYLTNRFYPDGTIDTPLTQLLAFEPDEATAKEVLFYETVRAEPAAQFFAEQVVWPALPLGGITRNTSKEELEKRFPDASEATIKRMVYSLVGLYSILDVASKENSHLRYRIHEGTLTGFLYILLAEFPKPGIYTFEALEQGPMRYWLLWDREWIRRQIYNLRDFGIIAKVSEIDNYRQFTLQHQPTRALQLYLEHPQRETLAVRERTIRGGEAG